MFFGLFSCVLWIPHLPAVSFLVKVTLKSIFLSQKKKKQLPADSLHLHSRKSKSTIPFYADNSPSRCAVSGYHCSCYGKTQPHSHGSKSTCIKPKGRKQNYYLFISPQSTLPLIHGALLLLLILCHIALKYCFINNWYKEILHVEIIIFSQTVDKTANVLSDINTVEHKLK